MTLTQDVKQKAIEVGFAAVGITNPDVLRDLPYGWVGKIINLRSPEDVMPSVKSVIILCFNAWDKAFSLSIDSPKWKGFGMHPPDENFESYYVGYEVMRNKAWMIVDYLSKKGFDSVISTSIPMKTAAVKCGLGRQGKNTLLISPRFGPRIMLVSVLTTAQLDIDEPFKEDLCGRCEKCVAACPTRALEPYKLKINRCMTYSAESPCSSDVPEDVRNMERKLIRRPTSKSYIECTICLDVCPVGDSHKRL